MKSITQIIAEIKKNTSTDARMLGFEILAYMQERESVLKSGGEIKEDTHQEKPLPEFPVKEEPKETVEEPQEEEPVEDITPEIEDVIGDEVKKLQPPKSLPKGTMSPPPIPAKKGIFDKLIKKN